VWADGAQTPLHYAVASENAECALALLRCGADPNATDTLGRSPMFIALHLVRASVHSMDR
jgi:ankyrin repeat protein